MALSSRHCSTLCALFAEPTRSDLRWSDFVSLCRALGGAKPKTGKTGGSRRLQLHGMRAVLHEPHPDPRMKKGSVESARDFLRNAGVTPAKEGCKCDKT
jgi:hypothetical protein